MLSDGTAPEDRLTSSVFLLSDGFAQLFSRKFTMACMLRSSFSIVDGFKSWWTEFCLAVSHISLRVVHENCAEFRDHVIFLNWWWFHQGSWPCLDSKLVNMVHSSSYYMQSTMALQMADKCIPQFLSHDVHSSCNRMLTMSRYDIQKDARVPESCPSTLRYFSNCSSPLSGLGIKLYHMHIMVCQPKLAKTLWREQSVGLYVLLRIYCFWSRMYQNFSYSHREHTMQNVTALDYHYVWIQVSTPVTKTVIYKPVYF